MSEAVAELNIKIVAPALDYLREQQGAGAIDEIARAVGLPAERLGGGSHWVDHETLEAILGAVRARVSSDAEFMTACAHGPAHASGPMRLLRGAIGPRDAYELGARNMVMLTKVSRFEPKIERNGRVVIRYTSAKPESRLMCLSRQAQMTRVPELWNLPAAHLTERACIAHGDDCCEYALDLYEPLRWLPIAAGLTVGLALGIAVGRLELSSTLSAVVFALLGMAGGSLLELRRANRINAAAARSINEAAIAVAREEADARREIYELNGRQHEWIGRLEQHAEHRSSEVERLARGMDTMRSRWVSSIRGFSHDLRNPLAVLKTNAVYLRSTGLDADGESVLDDILQAVAQMEKMLGDLTRVARSDFGSVKLEPTTIDVSRLGERLRSRIQALVFGSGIRVSVLPTREAPESIHCDPLLLDRVLDNLLTNAAKYTERGSIVIEIDGTPGVLTVKISDTGRGIEDSEIAKVFEPGGSREELRKGDGWGIGLSVVVQLLARIGGRLEVMSKPGKGTTFWAHFPVVSASILPPPPADRVSDAEIAQVVSIRRKIA